MVLNLPQRTSSWPLGQGMLWSLAILKNGDYYEGLRIFQRMLCEMCEPDEITLGTVLSICAKLGELETGLMDSGLADFGQIGQNLHRQRSLTPLSPAVSP